MDGPRFDALARALGAHPTRRGLLGGLTGLAAGLLGVRPGEAACGPDQVNRRGVCLCKTTGRPPGGDGVCPCARGLTRCGDACVNTDRDLAHCGGCDASCTAGTGAVGVDCRRGACRVTACEAGLADCDGDLSCETLLGTETDCGACGDLCTAPDTCGGGGVDGVCGSCTVDGDCPSARPCCQAEVCQAAPPPTLAMCEGRCNTFSFPTTAEVCGQPIACPPCVDCASLGCDDRGRLSDGPAGLGDYCIGDLVDTVFCSEACPPGSYASSCTPSSVTFCYPVCLGV